MTMTTTTAGLSREELSLLHCLARLPSYAWTKPLLPQKPRETKKCRAEREAMREAIYAYMTGPDYRPEPPRPRVPDEQLIELGKFFDMITAGTPMRKKKQVREATILLAETIEEQTPETEAGAAIKSRAVDWLKAERRAA